jgi:hypothetical protein
MRARGSRALDRKSRIGKRKEQTMRRMTFPAAATSVILSTAAMMAVPAAASVLGGAASANLQHASGVAQGISVQQVNWDGGYGYYHHRPFFHHRAFFFHHRFHRFRRW